MKIVKRRPPSRKKICFQTRYIKREKAKCSNMKVHFDLPENKKIVAEKLRDVIKFFLLKRKWKNAENTKRLCTARF